MRQALRPLKEWYAVPAEIDFAQHLPDRVGMIGCDEAE